MINNSNLYKFMCYDNNFNWLKTLLQIHQVIKINPYIQSSLIGKFDAQKFTKDTYKITTFGTQEYFKSIYNPFKLGISEKITNTCNIGNYGLQKYIKGEYEIPKSGTQEYFKSIYNPFKLGISEKITNTCNVGNYKLQRYIKGEYKIPKLGSQKSFESMYNTSKLGIPQFFKAIGDISKFGVQKSVEYSYNIPKIGLKKAFKDLYNIPKLSIREIIKDSCNIPKLGTQHIFENMNNATNPTMIETFKNMYNIEELEERQKTFREKYLNQLYDKSITVNNDGSIGVDSQIMTKQQIEEQVYECIKNISNQECSTYKNLENKVSCQLKEIERKHPIFAPIFKYIIYTIFGLIITTYASNILGYNSKRSNNTIIVKNIKKEFKYESFDNETLKKYRIVSHDGLDVRNDNNMKSKIICKLDVGKVVEILYKNKNWSLIEWKGEYGNINKGWTLTRYIARIKK